MYKIGDRIGHMTVIGSGPDQVHIVKTGPRRGRVIRKPRVRVKCICGAERVKVVSELRRGKGTKCITCSNNITKLVAAPKRIVYKLKNVYDSWKVLYKYKLIKSGKKTNKRILTCLCECRCGKRKYVRCSQLRSGRSKRCRACHLKYLHSLKA